MSHNEQDLHIKERESRNTLPAVTLSPTKVFPVEERGETLEKNAAEVKDRTSSARKIEANRRNSRNSTGPKTARGKQTVAKNAVKHGFFSKWLLADGSEDQKEFDDFYLGIRDHYKPEGWLEEMWVERIAVWSWRLRRLIRCESGHISRALAEHNYEVQQGNANDLAEPEAIPARDPLMDSLTDHLFLPEKEDLDKLMRYEVIISRQLDHAMGQLERLRARQGEGADFS